ncbi:unnamed protein product [Mytilus edulis]|uniref:Uncharacterized protein n=1 Tax=Mytilus edulis TaxID=6550 RepID=A0A8S3TUN0_MYTED|nr:unnamed protein product [Mytilus edulis]
MEKVNVKTEEIKEIKEDVGDVKHRLDRIEFMFAMTLKRQGENPEEYVMAWDEERTTSNLADEMQAIKEAGELDGNVPATVNINITVNSALTTEEKNVIYTVFSDNDTLDGYDYDEKLQNERKLRLHVKPDQQIASTSASETLYSRNKVKSLTGVAVKREIQEVAIERISVHLENTKFNFEIKGLPHSLSNTMDKEPGMTIEESIDFSVMWTWHYTQEEHSWDVVSVVDTINSRKQYLRDWFGVEYAKIDISGRLALQTTTASHTFCSLSSLETAVKSFLGKFIEVCDFKNTLKKSK